MKKTTTGFHLSWLLTELLILINHRKWTRTINLLVADWLKVCICEITIALHPYFFCNEQIKVNCWTNVRPKYVWLGCLFLLLKSVLDNLRSHWLDSFQVYNESIHDEVRLNSEHACMIPIILRMIMDEFRIIPKYIINRANSV